MERMLVRVVIFCSEVLSFIMYICLFVSNIMEIIEFRAENLPRNYLIQPPAQWRNSSYSIPNRRLSGLQWPEAHYFQRRQHYCWTAPRGQDLSSLQSPDLSSPLMQQQPCSSLLFEAALLTPEVRNHFSSIFTPARKHPSILQLQTQFMNPCAAPPDNTFFGQCSS